MNMLDKKCFNITIDFYMDHYCEHYSNCTNELWLQLEKHNDSDMVVLINKTVKVLIKDNCGKMPVYL